MVCIASKRSVVAVHGLAGKPYWSWVGTRAEYPQIHVDWLKELLPKVIPSCRILSFGYDSRYMRNAPKRDISNCAEELLHALSSDRTDTGAKGRPIIFICHSLGGIVVKEVRMAFSLTY
jgi:protein SERAC1